MWEIPFIQNIEPFNELLSVVFRKDSNGMYSAETEEQKVLLIKKLLEKTNNDILIYINDKESELLLRNELLLWILEKIKSKWNISIQVISNWEIELWELDILVNKLIYETKWEVKSFIVFDWKSYIYKLWDTIDIEKWSKWWTKNIFSINDPEISKILRSKLKKVK